MSKHVIETVTFRLMAGVSKDQFRDAAEQATAFMTAQPGFVRRRLSREENGTWVEHVEWRSMADAKAAAATIGQAESARAFIRAIDGPSIAIAHSELEVSVG
ncbi:MAG TPA: antibiotic biosynthesis monooxygenase [Polyangiaceae bacterium]|nr:antibiotic biosynthesis monooxygenase [Polyangiaceae bacterium]